MKEYLDLAAYSLAVAYLSMPNTHFYLDGQSEPISEKTRIELLTAFIAEAQEMQKKLPTTPSTN